MMNFATIFSWFENLQSIGSLLLLSFLLLVSLIIGWFWGRNIRSLKKYLYSPGEMKAYEFGLSETAYMIAVGTTLVFLSSLTVQYGSFFLIVVVVSWAVSLFVYGKLALGGDLIDFFKRKGAHLGEYIVENKSGEPRKRSDITLVYIISIMIALTFFGYYFIEILALKILAGAFIPSISSTLILGGAVTLTIIYTVIGGYKGTFKTDVIQTLFLVLALAFIIIFGMTKVGMAGNLTFKPFMPEGGFNSILLIISYSTIGIASLVTGLDIWARMRASEGEVKREGEKEEEQKREGEAKRGLWWSLNTLIPFLLVCCFGILFISLGLAGEGFIQSTIPTILPLVTQKIGLPIGFLMTLLIVVVISTADTSLITFSQAIEPVVKGKWKNLGFFRFLVIVVSFIGLIIALNISGENLIPIIFCVISFPVALTPIIIIRRFSKTRSIHSGISIIAIFVSTITGLGIGFTYPEYAAYSAVIILFLALLVYGVGILCTKLRRKRYRKTNG